MPKQKKKKSTKETIPCDFLLEDRELCGHLCKGERGLNAHKYRAHNIGGDKGESIETEETGYEGFTPFEQSTDTIIKGKLKFPDQRKNFMNMLTDILGKGQPIQSLTKVYFEQAEDIGAYDDPMYLYQWLVSFDIPPAKRKLILMAWHGLPKEEVIKLEQSYNIGVRSRTDVKKVSGLTTDANKSKEYSAELLNVLKDDPQKELIALKIKEKEMEMEERRAQMEERRLENKRRQIEIQKMELEMEKMRDPTKFHEKKDEDERRMHVLEDGSQIKVTDMEWMTYTREMEKIKSQKKEEDDSKEVITVPFKGRMIKVKRKDAPLYMAYDNPMQGMGGMGGNSTENELMKRMMDRMEKLENYAQNLQGSNLRDALVGELGALKDEMDKRSYGFEWYEKGKKDADEQKKYSDNVEIQKQQADLMKDTVKEGRLAREDTGKRIEGMLRNPLLLDIARDKYVERKQRTQKVRQGHVPSQADQEEMSKQLEAEDQQHYLEQQRQQQYQRQQQGQEQELYPPEEGYEPPPPQYPEEGYEHYEPPPPPVQPLSARQGRTIRGSPANPPPEGNGNIEEEMVEGE